MKKIIVLCMVIMLAGGLAFSQAQDPGFSNTVYSGFGNTDPLLGAPKVGKGDFLFQGFANYFTANVDIGKLTLAGDIIWKMGVDGGFSTTLLDYNFNVVMNPFKGFDVGVGTNLEWEVGPAPSSGPRVSAYDVPYYAGLGEKANRLGNPFETAANAANPTIAKPEGAGTVNNFFANNALAARYAFEDIIQVGVALHTLTTQKDFGIGIGIKANILDLFTIGFAYNGNFQESKNNSVYIGSTISAVKNVPIDIWMNFIPNSAKGADDGQNTLGGRVGITAGAFYIAPELSVTIWNKEKQGISMYVAIDTYMSITSEMLLGLNGSWGLGSKKNIDSETEEAGARLNINPYFIWNINDTNKLSIGIHLMPVWWQSDSDGENFYWSAPVAWRVSF